MPDPSVKSPTDNLYYFPLDRKDGKTGGTQSGQTFKSVPPGTVDFNNESNPFSPESLYWVNLSHPGSGVTVPKNCDLIGTFDALHLQTGLANDDVNHHTSKGVPPVHEGSSRQQSVHSDDTEMMKDYVDAKLEASEARTREAITSLKSDIDQKFAAVDVKFARIESILMALDAKLSVMPTRYTIWGASFTAVALIIAVLAFGFDRFDSGASIAPAIEQRVDQQMDRRFDELKDLIKQTSTSQPPSQSNNQP